MLWDKSAVFSKENTPIPMDASKDDVPHPTPSYLEDEGILLPKKE